MKRVAVVHEDGRVLRTYDIDFANLDHEPLDHWYWAQARENAIADKLIARYEVKQISCRFVDDLGEEKASERLTSNSEPTRIARIAKKVAWVAWIIVAIGAVIAISSTLSSP